MTKQSRARRRGLLPVGYGISSIALLGLLLSGCDTVANLNPFNSLESRYGNQSDACYYARKPLIDTGNVFSQSMITGAAVGGATGAAAGALIAKDKLEGAVVGGVIGAASGAAVGYLHAKQEQAKTRAELISSIDSDAARDNRQLYTSSNAIATLTRCRQNQIASVERSYHEHALSGAQARQQLQGIEAAVHDDNALIADVLGEAVNRSNTYVQARAESGGGSIGGGGGSRYRAERPGEYISTGDINVRSGASTSGKVVDKLRVGESVEVVSDAGNGWVAISHNGVTGYVSRRLLAEAGSSAARSAIRRGGARETASGAAPPAAANAPPPTAVASAAPPPPPPPPPPAEIAAPPPGDGGTATFVRTTEEAQRREDTHKQVESELQTRINNIPNSG